MLVDREGSRLTTHVTSAIYKYQHSLLRFTNLGFRPDVERKADLAGITPRRCQPKDQVTAHLRKPKLLVVAGIGDKTGCGASHA